LDSIIALLSWDKPSQPETNRPKATEPTTVQLYYFNELEDSKLPIEQQINTSSILPIQRTIRSSENLIADTIKLLLQGNLTENEKDRWFITEFPNTQFRLLDSQIDTQWTLVLTFSEVPGFTTGGSARMLILRKSIEKTALQFPQVKRVVFEPETIFQP
jgi:spore germination protein GerM